MNELAQNQIRRICVFCGASMGNNPVYTEAAKQLGQLIAAQHLELVYGGGSIGLMGVIADSVLENGGTVTGVIPEYLCRDEVMHPGLTKLQITKDLLERKAIMMTLSDAFIALPGGLGTLDEILEIVTWEQLEQHDKPMGLVNTAGYYDLFLEMLEHAVKTGFLQQSQLDKILVHTDSLELLSQIKANA